MVARQVAAEELIHRCEKGGWKTTSTPKGVKVITPEGPYVVPETYPSARALKTAIEELERRGLKDAEMAQERSEETLQRHAARQRPKAAVDTESTGKNGSALLAKAVGPYLTEPEEVHISWFAKPHPAPWMRWVLVTADIARYLLEHHNEPGSAGTAGTNRPQSEQRKRDYATIILSGQQRLTHQGMAMDTNGKVQDAQHRLGGIIRAQEILDAMTGDELTKHLDRLDAEARARLTGMLSPGGRLKVPFAFFVGMDPDNFKAIDEGLLRTANQLFTREGEKNSSVLQTALRLIIALREGDESARLRWRQKVTNQQLIDAFGPAGDELRKAASVGQSHAKKAKMSPGAFAAGQYLLYDANGTKTANGTENVFVDAFLEGVINGTEAGTRTQLLEDDPRAALRRTLGDYRASKGRSMPPLDQVGLMIMAWNYLVVGRNIRKLVWTKNTAIPQIVLCKDRGARKSAVPRALVGEVNVG